MEEKKVLTVRLSTVILLFIIFALIVALGVMYYKGFVKKDDSKNEIENKVIQTSLNEEENKNVVQGKENVEQPQNSQKGTFEISYKEETYKSYKSTGELEFENKRNLPIIKNSSNQSAADEIVKSLTIISDKAWTDIKTSSDEFKEFQYTAGVNYIFSTELVNDNYIVFKADQSGNFGGVGWTAKELYNYDAKTGKLLTLKSIASDYNNLEKTIVNKVVNHIKNNDIIVTVDNLETEINKLISTDGVWGYTNSGIEINLPKYSVSGGATGIITVEINKSDINGYLLENYKIK